MPILSNAEGINAIEPANAFARATLLRRAIAIWRGSISAIRSPRRVRALEALNTLVRDNAFPLANDLSLALLAETLEPVSSGSVPPSDGHDFPQFNANVTQSVVPTHTFDNAPELDVLLVPGGYGTGFSNQEFQPPETVALVAFIRRVFPKLKYLITVCTGAGLAARAGALDGRAATTNKAAWVTTNPFGLRTYWVAHARWVVSSDRKVWTTSGVSAGTDGFLAFLAEVYGSDGKGVVFADAAGAGIEYTRVKDSTDDPWARVYGVQDVPPKL